MIVIAWIAGLIIATFLVVVFRGAPYVPTHRAQVQQALDMIGIPKGGRVIDLGSGDGVFLKAAAMRGYHAIGYEINPVLCVISYLRCWKYRKLVSIHWRDFWLTPMPKDVDAVFVFLAGPYLRLLDKKLTKERADAAKRLAVVSYGFLIPGKSMPVRSEQALHLYYY